MSSGPWQPKNRGILLSLKDRHDALTKAELDVARMKKVLRAYSNISGSEPRQIRATAAALHLFQQAELRLLKALKGVAFASRILLQCIDE